MKMSKCDLKTIRIHLIYWIRVQIRNPNVSICKNNVLVIRVSVLDPYSIGPVDPDPYSESGSGSRRAKITHKRRKNSCFEVLDGLLL
jgi:hypothetical protein